MFGSVALPGANAAVATTPVCCCEQVTVVVSESAQPGEVSPSEANRVIVEIPTAVQVNTGFCAVASLNERAWQAVREYAQ